MPRWPPLEERFWTRVDKSGDCWLWTGGVVKDGYALIRSGGGRSPAIGVHRLSYRLAYGEFDPSLQVLHRCDTPLCVRPEHLFLGNHTDNMRDAAAKGRLSRDSSRRRNERGQFV